MDVHDELLLEAGRFRVVRRTAPEGWSRCVVLHPGAVAVLPVLEGNRVCLIRNHRVAVGETLIELPAGTLEAGESPADAARRRP